MRSRVLGADVHNVFLVTEEYHLFISHGTIRVQFQLDSGIDCFFIVHTQWVVFFRIIILTHRIAYPVITQGETTHIRVPNEDNAIEVIYFTFIKVRCFPNVAYTGQFRIFAAKVAVRTAACLPVAVDSSR